MDFKITEIVAAIIIIIIVTVGWSLLDTDSKPYTNLDRYIAKKTSYIKRLEKEIAKDREKITDLNALLLRAKTEELKNSIKKDIEFYEGVISYNEGQIKKNRIQVTKEAE